MKHFLIRTVCPTTRIILLVLLVGYLTTAGQNEKEYLDLAELIGQVKLAFLAAAAHAPAKGEISHKEIVLELKGVAAKQAGAKLKLLFFSIESGIKKENTHSISITLQPISEPLITTQGNVADALTDAILAVYFAAASAGPEYKVKSGQIELKCAIVRDSKLGLVLTPLEPNIDYKDELVQTIRITF